MFESFQAAVAESSSGGEGLYILTETDRGFLRSLSATISYRSAALLAASIHSLCELRREGLQQIAVSSATKEEDRVAASMEASLEETTIAFTGSVIESYPGYLDICERLVGNLEANGVEGAVGRVRFVRAVESSLFGAAIALAAAKGGSD